MALERGMRFGSYEIGAALGAGGMGEVYRATDTKLGREVAIKTLPAVLASDKDRLARFEREAKLLAGLNHAHIAGVYSLDEHDGTLYLAMELVEGETLEEKLKAGAMRLEEALGFAVQIAEALEAAHAKGVVHRDLKPANVMVTPDGVVKVLDFGLAKAFAGDPDQSSPAHSPALSMAMTQAGLILGTAGYMSPEQASGQATDQRADVWAFGVVLYEMLTGQPVFSGESVPHVLAAVLQSDPDWGRLPKNLHPRLKLLLERCLTKKPRDRLHAIADARIEIEAVLKDPQGVAVAERALERQPTWKRVLPVAAAALVTAVIVGFGVWSLRPGSSAVRAETQRLSVVLPEGRSIEASGVPRRSLALSPDGGRVVYVGLDPDQLARRGGQGDTRLELRSLATLEVRDLPGTAGARQPLFSPDGEWVGFFTTGGELRKVRVAGGNPLTLLTDINGARWGFGAWMADDTIVFGTPASGLRAVSAEGGPVTELTQLQQGERYHSFPAPVGSSDAVLFTVQEQAEGALRIEAVMRDSGVRRVVLENARHPLLLASGHLLFERDEAILVAPFDAESLTVTGPAVPLVDEVRIDDRASSYPVAQLAVSRSGTLAYVPVTELAAELHLVRRDGAFEPLFPPAGIYRLPRTSPDGQAIAFYQSEMSGAGRGAYVHDRSRGSTTRLGPESFVFGLAWHPDGRSLAISSPAIADGPAGIYLRPVDGTEQLLVPVPEGVSRFRGASWSADGTRLAYAVQTGSQHDIWILTTGDAPTTEPLVATPAIEHSPAFSPDGEWLAYQSDESGRREIYVQRFPEGARFLISADGGESPVWSRDGREIFFAAPRDDGVWMTAVAVESGGDALSLGRPEALFEMVAPGAAGATERYDLGGYSGPDHDVLPDGRFVLTRLSGGPTREIVVVQNWFEELRRLAPVE